MIPRDKARSGKPPRVPTLQLAVNGHRVVYLHPGQVHATRERCAISTVLGSCVAVCLFDPALRAGGMNHFLLPYHSTAASAPDSARFSNVAFERLIHGMAALGSSAPALQAKLFGGASVLKGIKIPLGARNVEAAQKLLARVGIPIVGQDIGGDRGRRLIFHTSDGTALVRLL